MRRPYGAVMSTHDASSNKRGEPSPREALARRRRRVRRGVGATSLATFAIAWGVIAGTGSTGATSSTAGSSSTASQAQSQSQTGSSSSQSQQQSPTAVTTRQS